MIVEKLTKNNSEITRKKRLNISKTNIQRNKRKRRLHFKLRSNFNNQDKLRMSITLSNNNIFMQLIDDNKSHTVCSFSTLQEIFPKELKGYNTEGAIAAGNIAAEKIREFLQNEGASYKEKGVYVDRGRSTYMYKYGRLHNFLEGIRKEIKEWRF